MTDKLPLDAKINLVQKMISDLEFYKEAGTSNCPSEQNFKIISRDEDLDIDMGARIKAFKEMNFGIKKIAFDTRRIDINERNPRQNLQYWHRSEDFIDDETSEKLKIFAKLDSVVKSIKEKYYDQPEWFDSYVRVLSSNLDRVQFKAEGYDSVDVFKPHLSYLEQLIYNRYRLTMDEIKEGSESFLNKRIMSKDEPLKKKAEFLISTGNAAENKKVFDKTGNSDLLSLITLFASNKQSVSNEQLLTLISSINNKNSKDSLAELFNGEIRKDGEKSVERVITIKIVDKVIE